MTEQTSEARDVVIERVYDAPRDLVFKAWTDPDQVAEWWGPEGFDVPRDKVNVEPRVGGRHDKVMVVADPSIAAGMGVEVGAEFPDAGEIAELVEGELLVLTHPPQPEIGLPESTRSRIEFQDAGDGRTRVTVTSGPYTPEMAPNAEAGWRGQLDKLERLLPSL